MDEFSSQLSESFNNLVSKMGSWINELILQLPNLILAILVGIVAYFFSKYIRKFAVKAASKTTKNKTVLNLVANLSTVIFGIFTLFLVLSILNLGDTINKILATAGVLGLAVGLALQDPMNNLFSGVFMSVRKLYKIGDLVETNGYFGTISDIDLRATKLKMHSGQEVVIPNKEVIQNPLQNFTVSGVRRVDISCGVSYGDDLEKAESVAISAIKDLPDVLANRNIDFIYNEFGDSSINFLLRFWVESSNQRNYLITQSNAIKALKGAFDENDIMIPYPIRTLDFGIRGGVDMKEMLPNSAARSQNV